MYISKEIYAFAITEEETDVFFFLLLLFSNFL